MDARVRSEPLRVSIVTPSYQMAQFLPATIESVLSQDYPHVDYLVMDGGSTDGTRELLEGYGDRLRYVSEPDDGQSDAINKGFHRTEGGLFAFLNADDTYLPGAVSSVVEAFTSDPGVDVVYGNADYTDVSGEVVGPYPVEPFDRERLARSCFIAQPATFVSREAWAACDGLDSSLHYALDYDLWIRMSERFRFVQLDKTLATCRMHPDNKTLGSRDKHYREVFEVVRRHYGHVPMHWFHNAAAQRVDGVDQFYEPSHQGRRSRALALGLALRHLPRQSLRTTVRDWQTDGHYDIYPDGWMSKAHTRTVPASANAVAMTFRGRHEAQVRRPLVLLARVNGWIAGAQVVKIRRPFSLSVPLPAGEEAHVELRSLWTWRPRTGGDIRRLSCVIDSVELHGP